MYATQYEIRLPADYDVDVVRQRVARRGHALDAFPGLGLEAHLIRERADGAAVDEYAPFYLWTEPAAMGRFLWGRGLRRDHRLVRSSGAAAVDRGRVAPRAGPAAGTAGRADA